MDLGLKGKYALVTGGSHGIGLATALALSAEGCNVAICSRTQSRLDEAQKLIARNGVETLAFRADALNAADIEAVMDGIEKKWHTLHILVNNVGGGGRWGSENVESTGMKVWEEVHQKNAMAAVLFTRRAIPLMRRQKWGRVIAVTSRYGKEGGGRPWFNMAKAAEVALMKTLSMTSYLVRDGITFNSVAPGGIAIPGTGSETERNADAAGFDAMVDREYPLGRLGTPEEVAHAVVFLCSARASLVNGAQLTVDGGQSRSY